MSDDWGGEGAAWGVLFGLGATALKSWFKEGQARTAIVRLFQEHFVDPSTKLVRQDRQELTVAGLTFTVDARSRVDFRVGRGWLVRVVNNTLAGDNPRRVRTFKYWDRPLIPRPGYVEVSWGPLFVNHSYYRKP